MKSCLGGLYDNMPSFRCTLCNNYNLYEMIVSKERATMECKVDQTAKADAGKPKLTLVPPQIIWDIAKIREYGNKKYGDPNNWKKVEPERYRDAAYRHFLLYLEDPESVDEESGLKHLWHLACNIAFLCDMEARKEIHDENE